jgi:hypothetical protein
MPRLKATWEVTAGVIPGQSISEYTKRWNYTSDEGEADNKTMQANPTLAFHATFSKKRAEAMDYYMQLSNPNVVNWVRLEFFWY